MDIFIDSYRKAAGTVRLTSNPYPVMYVESIDVAHAVTGGELYTWPSESVDITHAMTGGSLVLPLSSYAIPVESVNVAHALTGGALTALLLTYSNGNVCFYL